MDSRARRLARGDHAAFAELYDACADRLHRYLRVRLGSRTDADDVLQETFVRLARNREKLAAVENLMAYVFAIARNEATRLAERRAREVQPRAIPSAEDRLLQEAGDTFHAIETAEWVAASLARLRSEVREVIELKIYAALTFREISELTGLPQVTVATRYRSALETLRANMAEERG